jgi:predicted  nucleic acid-binding Zn-ribbon protein
MKDMNVTIETSRDQELIKQLLQWQPGSRNLLERLLNRFEGNAKYGAFAHIQGRRCTACHILIAAVRLARANEQRFIVCSNCSRFLYHPAETVEAPLPPAM